MISDLSLHLGGLFLSFFLQITAAYIACLLIARSLTEPRQRFRLWIGFLTGSAAYWIGLATVNLPSSAKHLASSGNNSSNIALTAPSFLIPLSWGPALAITGKILVAIYLATALFLLTVNISRQVRLEMVLRQGWTPANSIVDLFEKIRRELGISRCKLLVLPGLASPATAGWLRPRVLIPVVCEDLGPTSRLADVLYHELAHVARRDYFWASLGDLICGALFFHPAVWHARKLARFQGELACDVAVVEARPDRRVDYADSLAYFVRLRMIEEQAALGIDFASAPSSLGTRIRLILAGPPSQPWWKRVPKNTVALAIIGAFAVVAPALTVSLSFLRPMPATASPQTGAATFVPPRHRVAGSGARAALPAVTDLSKLRVGASSADVTGYSRTRADGSGHGDSLRDLERPWRESNSSLNRPSVVDVIGSAVAIAVSHGDHDHDKDDKHLLPQ